MDRNKFEPLFVALIVLWTLPASGETACVKYREGPCLDLAPFACTDRPESSFVRRVCYDAAKSYMLIKLNAT